MTANTTTATTYAALVEMRVRRLAITARLAALSEGIASGAQPMDETLLDEVRDLRVEAAQLDSTMPTDTDTLRGLDEIARRERDDVGQFVALKAGEINGSQRVAEGEVFELSNDTYRSLTAYGTPCWFKPIEA